MTKTRMHALSTYRGAQGQYAVHRLYRCSTVLGKPWDAVVMLAWPRMYMACSTMGRIAPIGGTTLLNAFWRPERCCRGIAIVSSASLSLFLCADFSTVPRSEQGESLVGPRCNGRIKQRPRFTDPAFCHRKDWRTPFAAAAMEMRTFVERLPAEHTWRI